MSLKLIVMEVVRRRKNDEGKVVVVTETLEGKKGRNGLLP